MADTGWVIPGTCISSTWANPSNAIDNNTSTYASCTLLLTQTSELRFSNFGLSIPANSVINGFELRIYKKTNYSYAISDATIRLYNGSSLVGDNKASSGYWPTGATWVYYGGSTDTWGTSLTYSLVNSSSFGVVVSAMATTYLSTAYIYEGNIKVYYTIALGSPRVLRLNSITRFFI